MAVQLQQTGVQLQQILNNSQTFYDVSVHNSGATYADLSTALAAIPEADRRSSMTIKYIDSTSSKYMQCRYLLTYTNSTAGNTAFLSIENWQGVDEVPTEGSNNLVKSGGVVNKIKNGYTQNISPGYLLSDGTVGTEFGNYGYWVYSTDYIPYTQGYDVFWKWGNKIGPSGVPKIVFYDSSYAVLDTLASNSPTGERAISSSDIIANASYIRASFYANPEDGFNDAILNIGTSIFKPTYKISGQDEQDNRIATIETALAGKQPTLTSANQGTNVTITEENGVVKINAAGGGGTGTDDVVNKIKNGIAQNISPGYLLPDGTVGTDFGNYGDWVYSTDYIPYTQGYDVFWKWGNKIGPSGVPKLIFYDSSYAVLDSYGSNSSTGERTILSSEIIANASYIRASFYANPEDGFNDAILNVGTSVFKPTYKVSGQDEQDNRIATIETALAVLESKDEYPTADSEKTVESKGIKFYADGYNFEVGFSFNQDGTTYEASDTGITYHIPVSQGDSVELKYNNATESIGYIIHYNSQKEVVDYYSTAAGTNGMRTINIPSDGYLRVPFKLSVNAYVKINNEYVFQPFKKDGIVPLRIDVERLKQGYGGATVSSNNKFKNSAIHSIASFIGFGYPNEIKKRYLCLLHITDIHGDVERFARMVSFANEHTDIIGGIIITGDSNENDWASSGFENTIGAYYDKTSLPMLPVIGNHDMGSATGLFTPPNTNEAVGQRFITPYISSAGAVQGGVDAGYYYKDFSTFNIRLIVINEYEMPRTLNDEGTAYKYPMWARWISQEQADWLVATLSSVPSGYGVIIAMHQLIDNIDLFENEFKCAVSYGSGDYYTAQRTYIDGTPKYMIQTIVDAYISKGVLEGVVFSGTITNGMPQVTVNADFSNANGEFICYINGHTHRDNTGKSSTSANRQIDINCTNGSIGLSDHYDDLYREEDTISEDVFNLISFDTDRKEIRLLRIGANVASNMKRRDYACISYAQS